MTIEPRIAAILLLTLSGCDLADRIEGKSPGREHVARLAAVTLPDPVAPAAAEPEPTPEPVAALTAAAPAAVKPEPPAPAPAPVMPVCRFSDAGFLICT